MSSVTSNEAVVWVVYYIRQLASFLIEWTMVRPCYLVIDISKKIRMPKHEKDIFEGARYVFDTSKVWDRFLRNYLLKVTKICSVASGITSTTEILGELAVAEINIMFLGFSDQKTHSTFGLKEPKAKDGSQGVDLLWISSLKYLGRFSVLCVEKINDDFLKVDCLWISGSNSGKRFQLNHIRTFDDLRKHARNKIAPTHIYRQTALIVIMLQILALFGLKSAYELAIRIWSFMSNVAHKIADF